jgi:serine/threonine-protein kinase
MRNPCRNEAGSGDIALIAKSIGLLVVLLTVITGFGLGGMLLVDRVIMPAVTNLGSEVELPDVVDQDFYAARRSLAEIGLQLEEIDEDFSAVIEEGRIIEQSPAAYSRVKRGRTVGVVVSRGPEEIVIPNLLRMNEDQARTKLHEFGLILGRVTRRPDNAIDGTIIDQRPDPNVKSLRNTPVDLTISSGPARMTIPVPRLIDDGLDRALATIRELKGRVWIEWVEDDASLYLTVVGQSPEPGTIFEGTPIFDLRVAIRTGSRPPADIDTTGIGAPPPWQRAARVLPPPFIPGRPGARPPAGTR